MNAPKKRNTGPDDSDRKHLTSREVERLIEATKGSRNAARDRCLLLLMFRHGLRVSEASAIRPPYRRPRAGWRNASILR